ncbi:hypothetical protein I8751_07655 [Nostocaceae cyanobacterium CENA357]|uniref:Uncharacterized protein n=1 Tax=Atlanticothrix silvestris CENA357 TaxID=1725252 RepID=A0A8J7H7Y9_9CYAN|nr:hypothetical protein [Atlanticothrix silvestris]MBH8552248.1 hypothetical protein [Atlanticothrix silvestris CENA357]
MSRTHEFVQEKELSVRPTKRKNLQTESYNPEAAPDAWQHVLELFQNNL